MSSKIVGLGATCAGGNSKKQIYDACKEARSLIQQDGLSSLTESEWSRLAEKTPKLLRVSKCTLLSFDALTEALMESGWSSEDCNDAGFIFASTTSQIDEWESVLPFYEKHLAGGKSLIGSVSNQSLGTPLLTLADHFGIFGPRALITSSCSSSLQALALAHQWIRSGRVRRCFVGGTEIHSTLTREGFRSLRLLTSIKCKPFDKDRSGINLGEGSAFLCLEKSDLRADHGWGFITGSGLSTDAYHPTSPHPEGQGSLLSMKAALTSAGCSVQDISWIYAHGTGSPANDLAESRAIENHFPHGPWVTSTKSIHGHTLAACGALESVLGLMAMKENIILPTHNHLQPSDDIKINVAPSLQPESSLKSREISHFLKNSLGFGGINASILFSKSADL